MTSPRADAFLAGRGIAVESSAIEQTLTDLWGPAVERMAGADLDSDAAPVTRVVLANLVVVTNPPDSARVSEALENLVARFPCRAIVAILDDSDERKIEAEVTALCHLPAPGLPQVCSERILLRAGARAADMLPGAIRPLLEPELPVALWWTGCPKKWGSLFQELAVEATRLILDAPEVKVEALAFGLDPALNPYARDASWFGLTPWRELIAQCFDAPQRLSNLRELNSARIKAAAPASIPDRASAARPAVWLAAWLAGQLDWTIDEVETSANPTMSVRFRGPNGPVGVDIEVEEAPADGRAARLVEVGLTSVNPEGESTFHIHRTPRSAGRVRFEICSPNACELARVVEIRDFDLVHQISAGLESSRQDLPFQRALPIALRLLGHFAS